jgi:transcriptional accessory protein Tex/SPT6
VRVLDVDLDRNRISLSMKTEPEARIEKKSSTRKRAPRKRSDNTQKKSAQKKRNTPFHNPFEEALGKKGGNR